MKLHYAKLSTYCQKAMIAFKEKGVTFTPMLVNMMDPVVRENFKKVYPIGKIPVLELDNGTMIPESTIICEYLEDTYASGTRLIPAEKDLARNVRLQDRMYDLYLNESVSAIFFDSLLPVDERDAKAVSCAKDRLDTMYKIMDKGLAGSTWSAGENFSMADCSAFAPLFYAKEMVPFNRYTNLTSYFHRLVERKSVNEVMNEVIPELKAFEKSIQN